MVWLINVKCCIKLYVLVHILLLNSLVLSAEKSVELKNDKSKLPFRSTILDAASKSEDGEACLTDGCKQAAFYVTSSIDESVDPCDNFYNFACGGFLKKSKIQQALLGTHLRLGDVQKAVFKNALEILDQPVDPKEPRIFQFAKHFYKACMDVETIERRGLQPLQDIIDKLGGWPAIAADAWDETEFSWSSTDVKARKLGFYPKSIFEIYVFNDLFNSSRFLLNVKPFSPYISSANLERGWNNSVVKAYHQYMVEVAVLLGADRQRATREMKDALDFEAKLSHAVKNPDKENMDSMQIITFNELIDNLKAWSWGKYINGLTKPVATIKTYDKIMLWSPYYTTNLKKLLAVTPKRVLANYMIWRIVVEVIPHLSKNMRDLELKFKKESTGRDRILERSVQCYQLIISKRGYVTAISAAYIRKYFTKENRNIVAPILRSIVAEAEKIIQEADWIDEKSRDAALKKAASMKQIIAYPNELLDNRILDEYNQKLQLHPDKHLENILNLNKFHYNNGLRSLRQSTNDTLWIFLSDSIGVNAYYYPLKNIFVILAGILQPPLFIPDWPFYALYGSIGFIIGHEMMHAFDKDNVLFDETGSISELFTPETQKKYDEKIQCFVDQYNAYRDEKTGLNVDGSLTVNENVADSMGIKVSYRAYQTWKENNKKELRLPTLKYTPEQIFWITSVGFLCGRMSTKQRINLLLTEVHTPDDLRIRGALSNSPNFAKAFNCKSNATMNPTRKCSLW